MKKISVLEAEKNIGINVFFTQSKGVGGKLRSSPEDFVVKEISNYPRKKEKGRFTIADVTAVNWETNLLFRELANRLHISRNIINFAGTKDKRAKTTQVMSFFKVSSELLKEVKIKDVLIEKIYYSDIPVKIGNLNGNSFNIIIRNLRKKIREKQIQDIAVSMEKIGGFPNFFGIQRFGITRPITHIVGKHIVKGNLQKALMSYIANPIEGENEDSFMVRKELEKNMDFNEALKSYPDYLNYEKAMLNKLVKNPEDFVGALKELPKNLLTMFIYAYQSFLYNKMLSERIKQNLALNQAVLGDIVLPIRKGITEQKNIRVDKNNVEKVNKQVKKGKAAVSGLLLGCDSEFSDGEIGEIEHKIVEKEKIDKRDFIIPDIPFISSSGSRRGVLAFIKNFDYKLNNDKNSLILKFDLDKGCYATSLLREFMKADDIKNY